MASVVIGFFSIFFFFAIKDPAMEGLRKKLNQRVSIVAGHTAQEMTNQNTGNDLVMQQNNNPAQDIEFDKLSTLQKINQLTKIVLKQIYDVPIIGVCILGASINKLLTILFSIYLIIWIQERKPIEEEAKRIYGLIMIVSVFAAILVLPLVGFICDRVESRKIVPFAYLLRTITVFMFYELKEPDTW